MPGENFPPMHPRCRCTIVPTIGEQYGKRTSKIEGKRVKIPQSMTYTEWKKSYIDKTISDNLTVDFLQNLKITRRSPKDFPVLNCKNFEELKEYWADNYNVKVSESIRTLHFESVREATSGVEAVIKEFPQTVVCLKKFNLYEAGIMSTFRQQGLINFNPNYFKDFYKLLSELEAGVNIGYYHRNMNLFSVGAHEAGHILEDLLITKNAEPEDFKLRITARKIIREAYKRIIRETPAITIGELKNQICTHAFKENNSECLADAVSDYVTNGKDSAKLSIKIWETIRELLNK